MQASGTIRIGTRGSPLALRQVEMVREALSKAHPDLEVEVVPIKTSGDWKPSDGEVRLNAEEGGKGLFAKEIEQALMRGDIDCAVHSMKDMETKLDPSLTIQHMLPREDVRDVLIVSDPKVKISSIHDLQQGARIGTCSVRREAVLKSLRPDLEIVPIRGNIQTRIDKCRDGQFDATLLAYAGLKRLGLDDEIACIIETDHMVPAAGQGAVGIEARNDDKKTLSIFDQIGCMHTLKRVMAERAVLEMVDGSCHTPVGILATFKGNSMHVFAQIWSLDGKRTFFETGTAQVKGVYDDIDLGKAVGSALKSKTPSDILSHIIT